MGDLRNKYYKELRAERHRQFMAKHYPRVHAPPPPPPACWCGLNSNQVTIIARQDRSGRYDTYCVPHYPVECACWELATRMVDGKPMCERCWAKTGRA